MMRFISKRLWQPFDKALEAIECFKLENGVCPQLAESDIKEFTRLNVALERLMTDSLPQLPTAKGVYRKCLA